MILSLPLDLKLLMGAWYCAHLFFFFSSFERKILLFIYLATPQGMWDLSSLTEARTRAL